ncbi:MAG TPA: hypothetical protein VGA69_06670, partial [Nitriliruptorales bacterium]
LWAVVPDALGRIEFDTLDEGREEAIVGRHLMHAILVVFRRRVGGLDLSWFVERFDAGLAVDVGDLTPASVVLDQFGGSIPGLAQLMQQLDVPAEDPAAAASVVTFALEGLYLAKRINKERYDDELTWRYGAA